MKKLTHSNLLSRTQFFLGLTCWLIGVSSCNTRESAIFPRSSPVTNEKSLQQINQHLNNFSFALAQVMESDEVRTLLKEEALKRFDGDYDIMYKNIANVALSDGSTLRNRLERLNPSASAEDNFGKLANLQISVPVNIEKWDTQAFVPYVAVNEWGYQEKDIKVHKSYDSQGKIHLLNAHQAPDFPVVVVGLGERVDANGNLKAGYANINNPDIRADHDEEFFFDDPNKGDGGGGGGGRTGSDSCRFNKDEEYLAGINSYDLGVWESWANGSPEFWLMIKSPQVNFGTYNLFHGRFDPPHRRSVYENNWWNPNSGLFFWDKAAYGNDVLYYWYEDDGGEQNQTITLASSYTDATTGIKTDLKVDVKIGSLDDHIGYRTVSREQCPSTGYYDLGSNFKFKSLGRR